MRTQIIERLKSIEQSEKIKILVAVESGSRAWGFASKDSDWDVRFLYVRPLEWYVSIDDRRDTLDYPAIGQLDFSGWDMRKALRLFRKSNPPLLEWLRSPIVYLEQSSAAQGMRDLSEHYFNPRSCIHHYLHMADGNFREYLRGDFVKVKKYFYVLRPVLACQWIMRTNTMAPMEFERLLATQVEDRALRAAIDQLIARKRNSEELDMEPTIRPINDFLDERIAFFEDYVKKNVEHCTPDTEKLDLLFRDTLKEVWR
jgi:predicted nucleotidyltransferase